MDWMLLLLFLAPSVERVTLPRPRERTGCLALVGWKRKAKKTEREFSLTDRKKTASSPLGFNIKEGGGKGSRRGGGIERGRAAKDERGREHSTVHSKRKEEDSIPDESRHWTPLVSQRSQLFPLGVSAIPMVALPSLAKPRGAWRSSDVSAM